METHPLLFSDEYQWLLDRDLSILQKTPLASGSVGSSLVEIIAPDEQERFASRLLGLIAETPSAEFEACAQNNHGNVTNYLWRACKEKEQVRVLARKITPIDRHLVHEINNPLTVIQTRAFQLSQMAATENLDLEKLTTIAESLEKAADKISVLLKPAKRPTPPES